MKKIACILAVLLVIMSVGCSQPNKTEEQAPEAEPKVATSTADGEWKPEKDFTFVVPFEAGGTADVPARLLTEYLNKYSDKKFVVVNKPGSGGRVAAKEIMRAEPDGYTIMHVPAGWPMQKALGIADFSYEDFEPVTMWLDSWLGVAVKADSPYETYEDFIAAAKANPHEIKFASVTGTIPYLAELAIADKEDVDFNVVDLALNSKAPELLSGRIDAYIDGIGALKQYVDSGDFKVLMAFSYNPIPGYEDIPLAKDKGFEDYEYLLQSFGLWAPKGTPKAALDYISDVFKKAAEDPECQEKLHKLAFASRWESIEDYSELVKKIQEQTDEKVVKLVK